MEKAIRNFKAELQEFKCYETNKWQTVGIETQIS